MFLLQAEYRKDSQLEARHIGGTKIDTIYSRQLQREIVDVQARNGEPKSCYISWFKLMHNFIYVSRHILHKVRYIIWKFELIISSF